MVMEASPATEHRVKSTKGANTCIVMEVWLGSMWEAYFRVTNKVTIQEIFWDEGTFYCKPLLKIFDNFGWCTNVWTGSFFWKIRVINFYHN